MKIITVLLSFYLIIMSVVASQINIDLIGSLSDLTTRSIIDPVTVKYDPEAQTLSIYFTMDTQRLSFYIEDTHTNKVYSVESIFGQELIIPVHPLPDGTYTIRILNQENGKYLYGNFYKE